jgi:hypothetical protein
MTNIITIGFNKDGEADFAISGEVCGLSLEKMDELRRMISVAIGTTEQMFRSAQQHQIATVNP